MSITYQYKLDGGSFTNTASSGTALTVPLTGLSIGYHTLQIRATDSVAGSGPPTTTVFQVTVTPPATPTLVSLTAGDGTDLIHTTNTTSKSATAVWTVPAGATSALYMDGIYQGTQTSPYATSSLGAGAHTIRVYSVQSGVASTLPLSVTWSVIAVKVLGPGSGTYARAVPLPGVPGVSVPVTIIARATDTDLSANTTSASVAVTVLLPAGNNPPQCSVAYPSNGSTLFDVNVAIIVTAQDLDAGDSVVSVQASIDSGVTWINLTNVGGTTWQSTVACPADATTTVNVRATDTHGAVGSDSSTFRVSTSIPVVPGPGPRPIPKDTAIWRVVIYDHRGQTLGSIQPDNLNFSMQLNQPGSITFDLNIQDAAANIFNINPNLNDWALFRNTTKMMAGYLSSVQVDTDTRALSVTGTTWEGYFARVHLPFDPTNLITDSARHLVSSSKVYTGMDLFAIVRDLVRYVIDQQNNTIGPMLYTTLSSGFIVNQQVDASQLSDLLTIINDLSGASQGFDWAIGVNKRLFLYTPHKGIQSPLVLDLESNVKQIVYTNDGIRGNFVTASGSGSSGSSRVLAIRQDTQSQGTNRLVNEVVDYGTVPSVVFLNQLASAELALAKQDQVNMQVTCIPLTGLDVWTLAGVGDWVRVKANLEYTNLDAMFRCVQIDGTVDADGNEEITYHFAPNTVG